MLDSRDFAVPARLDKITVSIEPARLLPGDLVVMSMTGHSRKTGAVAWSVTQTYQGDQCQRWAPDHLAEALQRGFTAHGMRQPNLTGLPALEAWEQYALDF